MAFDLATWRSVVIDQKGYLAYSTFCPLRVLHFHAHGQTVHEEELQMATSGGMGRLRRRDAVSATACLQVGRQLESFQPKNRLILAERFWSRNFLRFLRVVGNLSGLLAAFTSSVC